MRERQHLVTAEGGPEAVGQWRIVGERVATTGGNETVSGAAMTSPSWASSVTRAFDSTRSSVSGSGPGSGIPATIDRLSVDLGKHAAVGGRQPLDERHVLDEPAPALADLDPHRVQAGSRQRQFAPHLAAGSMSGRRGSAAAG